MPDQSTDFMGQRRSQDAAQAVLTWNAHVYPDVASPCKASLLCLSWLLNVVEPIALRLCWQHLWRLYMCSSFSLIVLTIWPTRGWSEPVKICGSNKTFERTQRCITKMTLNGTYQLDKKCILLKIKQNSQISAKRSGNFPWSLLHICELSFDALKFVQTNIK